VVTHKKYDEKKVSLSPLNYEQAVGGLIFIKPPKRRKRRTRK
jgi:hypothetical protein